MIYYCIHTDTKKAFKCKKVRHSNDGTGFEYIMPGRITEVCFAPTDYPYIEGDGWRAFFKNPGNSSASLPVDRFIPCDPDCPGWELSLLCRTNVMAIGYERMTKSFPWLWIILAGLGILAIVGVIIFLRSQGAPA